MNLAEVWALRQGVAKQCATTPTAYGYFPQEALRKLTESLPDIKQFVDEVKTTLGKLSSDSQPQEIPEVPDKLDELEWPAAVLTYLGPSNVENIPGHFWIRPKFWARGGKFNTVRLRVGSGSTKTTDRYQFAQYSLDDPTYDWTKVGGNSYTIEQFSVEKRTDTEAVFCITAGNTNDGDVQGEFICELLSDDGQFVFAEIRVVLKG